MGTNEHVAAIGAVRPQGTDARGFTLVELLVVMAILVVLAIVIVPQVMEGLDRSRQRRTLADMRDVANSNERVFVDTGAYVKTLADLQRDHLLRAPDTDAWGNNYEYLTGARNASYLLISRGSDGATGPAAPLAWIDAPYEPDLILADGSFIQAPEVEAAAGGSGSTGAGGGKKDEKK